MTFMNYPFKEIGTLVKNPEEQTEVLTKKEKRAIYQHNYYLKNKDKYKWYIEKYKNKKKKKQKRVEKKTIQELALKDSSYQKLLKEKEKLQKKLDLFESLKEVFKKKGIIINDNGSIFIS